MKKEQFYLSTIAEDAAGCAAEYGLGLEIAEYCTASNMDECFPQTDAVVRKKMEAADRFILHAPFNELFPTAIDPKAVQLAHSRLSQAVALAGAYGTDAFGPGQQFVSAQASVVATMVSGIPNLPAFVIGIVAGIVLYCLGLPSMMLGLGVYLPFYMSLSAPVGALVTLVDAKLAGGKVRSGELDHNDTGIIVASGLLGGESIVGVAIALMTVATGLLG